MNILKHNNFIVEEVEEIEENVYDIEVEDNHNFFANNILVHNSMYISVTQPLKNLCLKKNIDYNNIDDKEYIELMQLISNKIEDIINSGYSELSKRLNVYEETFVMNREIFGKSGIWIKKKNYLIKMVDKEGQYISPDSKPLVKGFDIAKKSDTTKYIIDLLYQGVELIFQNDITKLRKFEKDKKIEYFNLPFSEITTPKRVSSMDKHKDVSSKGAQVHIKAALIYNYIIKENKLEDKYPLIENFSAIKYSYIKEPNNLKCNCIGYINGIDADEFFKMVQEKYNIELDLEKMWQTEFIHPMRRITDAIKWNMGILKTKLSALN